MKIVLYTTTSFVDQQFPLLKSLQQQGYDVFLFMQMSTYNKRENNIDIKQLIDENDIIPSTRYHELDKYHEYMDFCHFYIINQTNKKQVALSTQKLFRKFSKIIKKINPDIILTTSTLGIADFRLWRFRKKLRFIINDPFPHSGETGLRKTFFRNTCFRFGKSFVLLNQNQVDKFSSTYHIDKSRIVISRLGTDDSMRFLAKDDKPLDKPTKSILFFGRISPYKGIEYLCEAMKKVHESVPEANLTIAGGGKMYLDFSKYANLDYIKLVNRYIPTEELAHLLHSCDFTVCPYTDATQSGVIMTSYTMDKPVIATNVGGLSTMVDEGKTGYLIPPKDIDALANAMTTLLKDDSLLKSMSDIIHKKYQEGESSWQQIAKDYLK